MHAVPLEHAESESAAGSDEPEVEEDALEVEPGVEGATELLEGAGREPVKGAKSRPREEFGEPLEETDGKDSGGSMESAGGPQQRDLLFTRDPGRGAEGPLVGADEKAQDAGEVAEELEEAKKGSILEAGPQRDTRRRDPGECDRLWERTEVMECDRFPRQESERERPPRE